MKKALQRWGLWLALAMGGHAWFLFAVHRDSAAIPVAMGNSDSPVEVALVEAGPTGPAGEEALPQPLDPTPPAPAPPDPAPVPPEPEPPVPPTPPETPAPPVPAEPPPEPAHDTPPPLPKPEHHQAPPPQVNPASHRSAPHAANPGATASSATATGSGGVPGGTPGGGAGSGAGNSKLQPRYNPRPDYPSDAKNAGQQGVVLVAVDVDSNGVPTSVEVRKSSGFSKLDDAAVTAVRRWRFQPSRIGGIAVAAHAEVPIRFNIQH